MKKHQFHVAENPVSISASKLARIPSGIMLHQIPAGHAVPKFESVRGCNVFVENTVFTQVFFLRSNSRAEVPGEPI